MPITSAVITMPMDGAHGDSGSEDTLHYAGYKIEQFSADSSTVDGIASKKIVDWRWSADDGWTDSGRHVQHRFDSAGTHTVTCVMTADDGATATATKDVVSTTPSLVMDTYHKAAGSDSDTGADDAHAYSSWERSQYRWREGDITHSRGTPGRLRTKSGDTIDYTANSDDVTVPKHYHDPDYGPLIYDNYGGAPRANVHFAATKLLEFLADHHVPDQWGWSVYFRGLRFYKDAQEDSIVGSNIPGSQFDDCVLENGGTAFQGDDTNGNIERAFVGGSISGSATNGLYAAMAWLAVDGVTIAGNALAGVDAEHQIYGTDITHGCLRRLTVVGSDQGNDGVRTVSSHYVYVADCDVSGIWNSGASYYPGSNGITYNASTHWIGERLKAHDNHDTACAIDFNHNDDSLLRNFLFYGSGPVGIVLRGYDATHKANDTRLYHGVSYTGATACFTQDSNATATEIRGTIFVRTDSNPFFTVDSATEIDSDYNCFWRVGSTNDTDDANFCVVGGVTKSFSQWKALLSNKNDQHSFFRDPLFTDPSSGDFTLQAGSPCAAAMPRLGEVPRDFADVARSSTTAIGAFEASSSDVTPPTVSITSPADGATVSGTISVAATASDDVGVVGVQFKLDGANLGAEQTSGPYSISWDTTGATAGAHTLTAVARDAAGNTTTSAAVHVTVDNGAPTVSITSPADGASVRGTISVAATASDDVGVVGVQFKLDGTNLGAEQTSGPYSVSWDTTGASNGAHTLTAVARDAAGHSTTSAAIHVTVDNSAPTVSVTSPSDGSSVRGTVSVTATASDNVGVVGVQFKLDGANLGSELTAGPFTLSWDTTPATDGAHVLTAVARDAAGNTTTSAAVHVTVDNSAPTVAISSPAEGAKVRGTISVAATASDNVGVAGVQFKLDGSNLGAEQTTGPYSVSWDTTGASNGAHTLTAVARDAVGNTTTSAPVHVTVDNTAPAVAITAPTEGTTVVGSVLVTATASDNIGVVGVQMKLDGSNLGAELTVAPFSLTWDSTGAADGAHTLTAVARDAAGNTTTSAAVHVTVDNTAPAVAIIDPEENATVGGTIDVSADASDAIGVVGVQFKLDGVNLGAEVTSGPFTISWDTAGATNGDHALTAVARDAAGHSTVSAAVHVTVDNAPPPPPPDTDPPEIRIVAPFEGSNVSGTIGIAEIASDNVGVVGVQFQLDGVNLGDEQLVEPFTFLWDTTGASHGSHALTAIARDDAGNTATSDAVHVVVDNPEPPPPPPPPPPPGSPGGPILAAGAVQSRKSIRQGVRRLLLGRTSAGSRVFTNRSEAIQHDRTGGELPALLVLTPTEPVEMAAQAPPVYRRRLRIAIELIVHRNEGFEAGKDEVGVALGETETEELDRLCRDVEQLLLADPTLEMTTGIRLADDCEYVDTQFDFQDRAEQVIGSARIQFDFIYQTEILERGVALAVDLKSVHVDHAPKPPGSRVVATDDVDVPTE